MTRAKQSNGAADTPLPQQLIVVSQDQLVAIVRDAVREAMRQAPAKAPEKKYLDASEIAAHYGVSRATITNWIDDGCPHMRRGQILRFEFPAVDAWFRARGK